MPSIPPLREVPVWSREPAASSLVRPGPVPVSIPGPVLVRSGPGPVLVRSGPGPVLVRSGPGPVLVQSWSGPGPVPVRSWSDPGPVLVRSWSGPVLVRSASVGRTVAYAYASDDARSCGAAVPEYGSPAETPGGSEPPPLPEEEGRRTERHYHRPGTEVPGR